MKSDDVKREIDRMTDNLKQVNDLKLNMEIGAEIHSDKGYKIGTKEDYEKFAENRRNHFGKNE
jgi:hypothetical protein